MYLPRCFKCDSESSNLKNHFSTILLWKSQQGLSYCLIHMMFYTLFFTRIIIIIWFHLMMRKFLWDLFGAQDQDHHQIFLRATVDKEVWNWVGEMIVLSKGKKVPFIGRLVTNILLGLISSDQWKIPILHKGLSTFYNGN